MTIDDELYKIYVEIFKNTNKILYYYYYLLVNYYYAHDRFTRICCKCLNINLSRYHISIV